MLLPTSCHLFGAPGSWSGWRSSWAARRRRGGSRLRGSQSMVMESALDRWEGMGNGGEREEGGRRRGTWSPEGSRSGSAKGSRSGSELFRVLARRGRRRAGAGGGGRQGQAGWARRGRARRLLQGPKEALAPRTGSAERVPPAPLLSSSLRRARASSGPCSSRRARPRRTHPAYPCRPPPPTPALLRPRRARTRTSSDPDREPFADPDPDGDQVPLLLPPSSVLLL